MFNFDIAKKYMNKENIDGWLLYDFRGINTVAHNALGKKPTASRRYFFFIPKIGDPILLINALDRPQFELYNFHKVYYKNIQELETCLREVLKNADKVLMDYSSMSAIPTMSLVDAGTMELIKNIKKSIKIISSADCYQLSMGKWDARSLFKHLEATKKVNQIKDDAFRYIEENIKSGKKVTEYDVQQKILQQFSENNMITEDVPVVAVNRNSSNPHYEPSEKINKEIKRGDWVLIDLWAKFKEEYAVFADVTWVGYMGENIPEKYINIFNIVKKAQESVIKFLQKHWREDIKGWQLDDIARKVIEDYGFGDYFIHRTGHSIAPGDILHSLTVNLDNFETHDTRRILPGIGFSIEPGIYLKEFGVRLEVNVYIDEEKGPIVTTPKQDKIIQFRG